MSQPLNRAPQACRACRRLKRRCNKALPICSQCSRLHKTCEYPYLPSPEPATSPSLADRLQTLEQLISTHGHMKSRDVAAEQQKLATAPRAPFPGSFFLDRDFFQPLGPNQLSLGHQAYLQQAVASHIGSEQEQDTIVEDYFVSSYRWLPMISQKLFRNGRKRRAGSSDGCTSLLLLAMKLCTSPIAPDPMKAHDSQLYKLTSSLCIAVETSGAISLRLIQSVVLLAVFEISHGLYPAAYLTVGRVARLATIAGLHNRKSAQQLFKPADTWSSWEEHRRTWWAIFVLDRFVSIGTSGLPLAAPEPSSGDLLPVNDKDWDQGNNVPNEPLYTKSFNRAANVGSFARTCLAAHTLGKVLAHQEAKKTSEDVESLLSEAWHLHTALGALHSTLEEEGEDGAAISSDEGAAECASKVSALALCTAAEIRLYNNYGCNDPSAPAPVVERIPQETEMQRVSFEGIKRLASTTAPRVARTVMRHHQHAAALDDDDDDDNDDEGDGKGQSVLGAMAWGPFVPHVLYHAATECVWFVREDHEPGMYTAMSDVVNGLEVLSRSWGLGVEYMALLEQSDVLDLLQQV